jgi:hypothetical protein
VVKKNPIMLQNQDYTTFTVDDGIEIILSVYSPSGKVTAAKHNARDENHDDSTKKPF